MEVLYQYGLKGLIWDFLKWRGYWGQYRQTWNNNQQLGGETANCDYIFRLYRQEFLNAILNTLSTEEYNWIILRLVWGDGGEANIIYDRGGGKVVIQVLEKSTKY